jgi:alpha-glucosidase
MGYINPYVLEGKSLYQQAVENDYLAYDSEGDIYLVDFGEFYCGVVDFTNPEAFNWYKEVIKEKLIEFGLDGWMADFGEYLPTDCVLSNGKSAEIMHNAWPAIWAKLNYEAVKEAGKLEETLYFMRAGFTGNQKYCTLMWAGDQSVNWSLDDGLASVIPAALSMGMSGCGLHHSDIGGYTSLHGNIRSRELFMRWAEMAAFTPVMRTHEGNRPDENFQFYDDQKAIKHLRKMTDVYTKLKSYIKEAVKVNSERGVPVQRPLFLHYEEDEKTYDLKYQYLLGRDILVAPVYEEDKEEWELYLPDDNWVHFWTGKEYTGGEIKVKAPLGQPPVFYRKNSKYRELFEEASEI